MKNKLAMVFLMIIAVGVIASVYFYNSSDETKSSLVKYQQDLFDNDVIASNQWENNDANTLTGGSGAPSAPVWHTINVLNFEVKPRENAVPYVNVNPGDQVMMKWNFQSSEDIETATVEPWLYRYGYEPITSGITQGIPNQINKVKANQNYEYEFALTIPGNPKDTNYAFAVFMSGCSSVGCGYTPQIDFIVGNGGPPPSSGGNILVVE